jgi:hypothetical protein
VNDVHPETEILLRLRTAIAACDSQAAAEATDRALLTVTAPEQRRVIDLLGVGPMRARTPVT